MLCWLSLLRLFGVSGWLPRYLYFCRISGEEIVCGPTIHSRQLNHPQPTNRQHAPNRHRVMQQERGDQRSRVLDQRPGLPLPGGLDTLRSYSLFESLMYNLSRWCRQLRFIRRARGTRQKGSRFVGNIRKDRIFMVLGSSAKNMSVHTVCDTTPSLP